MQKAGDVVVENVNAVPNARTSRTTPSHSLNLRPSSPNVSRPLVRKDVHDAPEREGGPLDAHPVTLPRLSPGEPVGERVLGRRRARPVPRAGIATPADSHRPLPRDVDSPCGSCA